MSNEIHRDLIKASRIIESIFLKHYFLNALLDETLSNNEM